MNFFSFFTLSIVRTHASFAATLHVRKNEPYCDSNLAIQDFALCPALTLSPPIYRNALERRCGY